MSDNSLAPIPAPASSTHPLILGAAASVTTLALAGTAALFGWLPSPANPDHRVAATTSPPAIAATGPVPYVLQAKPRQAAEPASHAPAPAQRRAAQSSQRKEIAVSPAPTFRVSHPDEPIHRNASSPVPVCADCGIVQAVKEIQLEPKASGGGAIVGGILGGIVGNQIGKGATRDIATVLGAAGGAYAGNHIEKSAKEAKRYDLVVRFEDGSMRSFSSDQAPAWSVGDRVRLQNGVMTSGGGRPPLAGGTI